MPSAPLTVADTLELSSPAGTARATAARTFGRCPDEVPAARRFLRETLDGLLAKAKKIGYPVVADMKTEKSRWVYIKDPSGIWIELFQG